MKTYVGIVAMACLALAAASGQAAIVYDGFEAVSGGSATAYDSDGSIIGQGPARTGFSGTWAGGSLATGVVDYVAREDGLAYPGAVVGPDGRMELYRIPTSGSSGSKTASRALSYVAPDSDDIYFALQISYTGSLPGTAAFAGSSRDLQFNLDSSGNLTIAPAGSSAMSYSEAITAGISNLVVVRAINDESGAAPGSNPNSGFYDYLEVWINPTITGGSLGTPDATGYGIVRNLNGGGNAVAYSSLILSGDVTAGEAITIDEVYVTTDLADIVVPEPATMSLLAIGGLGILRRRKA